MMKEEPTRKELDAEIDEFLKARRQSSQGGGYAAIELEDMVQLEGIVNKLIRLKSETDADGAATIEFGLIDRQYFQRSHYAPVPYPHGFKNKGTDDMKAFEAYYSRVLLNLSIAMDAAKTADSLRQGMGIKFTVSGTNNK